MVGMKPKENEEMIPASEKAKRLEAKQDEEQVTQEEGANQDKQTVESKTTSLELGDLMAKLEQSWRGTNAQEDLGSDPDIVCCDE